MSGAGAHKDKKKAIKQGEVKHKKKEYMESLHDALKSKLIENGMDEGSARDKIAKFLKDKEIANNFATGKSRIPTPQERAAQLKAQQEKKSEAMNGITGPGMMIDPNNEDTEPEGETLKNSLHTIIRVATDLDHRLSTEEDFPEWVSEKIGAVQGMMVSVMNYLLSDREMQHSHDEVDETMLPAKAFAGSKKNKLGPAGQLKGSMKRPARAGDLVGGGCEESVEWTHESLADQLFDHERTYEDKLSNLLNKKLGK
jgi:hypothetical protein